MVAFLLDLCIVILTLSTLTVAARIIMGPTLPDRVVAADGATTHIIALVVLVGMKLETMLMFDIALALSILSFFTSLFVGKYLEKGTIIDDASDH